MRARTDCAALVGQGRLRINRQPTDKPHARLRVGDVVTLPVRGEVRVVRVLALAARRGPATEARLLYEEVAEPPPHLARGRKRRHIASSESACRGDCLMTYVVTENCIRCKYMDCVEVCPVDCFYVGENMLVIHPDECIDCGVCEPECPVEAIVPDSDDKAAAWVEQNRTYAAAWPNITRKGTRRRTPTNGRTSPERHNFSRLSRVSPDQGGDPLT